MKIMMRFTSLICAFIIMILFMSDNKAAALSDYASGTCGREQTWQLNNGVLTVSGTGLMYGYGCREKDDVPWHSYKDQITKVVIEEGVQSIGMHMFSYCKNLTEVSLPSTLSYISKRAFENCDMLRSVEIPYGVTMIDHLAFGGNDLLTVYIPPTVKDFGISVFSFNRNLTIICDPGSEAEKYAKSQNKRYTSDYSIMNNLEAYKQSLIENEEYILSSCKIDFNISHTKNNKKKIIKLDWDDISGASKYKIYRYNYNTKSFDLLGSVQKSQCVIKKVKPDSNYYLKIAAVTDKGIIEDCVTIK